MFFDRTHERKVLHYFEDVIRNNRTHLSLVGGAFAAIKDRESYRAGTRCRSFQEYCRKRWDLSPRHANRLIAAAQVVKNLKAMETLPIAERQARPLASLPPDRQRAAWGTAVQAARGGVVTSRMVAEAVKQVVSREAIDRASEHRERRSVTNGWRDFLVHPFTKIKMIASALSGRRREAMAA